MANVEKRALLQTWLSAHLEGNSAPLFIPQPGLLKLTSEAEQLLKDRSRDSQMCLYVVCIGDPVRDPVPVYVGKSSSPWSRWKNGHLRALNKAALGETSTAYSKWLELFARVGHVPFIVCLRESDIRFPPIPGFPATVGSVEYQLISLASDAFPGYLLNHEGAPT